MSTFINNDHYQGTRLVRSMADKRQDRAVRVAFNDNGDAWRTYLKTGIDNIIAESGVTTHPDDATLPLASVEAQGLANGRAMLTAIYARLASAAPTQPAFSFATVTAFGERKKRYWYSYTVATKTYTEIAEGPFSLATGDLLIGRTEDEVVAQFAVPVVVTSNPLPTVKSLFGYYNSDAVTIDGMTCDASTLQFRGVRIAPIDTHLQGIVWTGYYIFNYFPAGYGKYRVDTYQLGTPPSTEPWLGHRFILSAIPPRKSTAFAGAFPVHNGVGP